MAKIIVSYDGTASDEDALAFGRLLSKAGASVVLAYVRHHTQVAGQGESLATHDASNCSRPVHGGSETRTSNVTSW